MKLMDCKHGSIVKIGNVLYRLYRLEQFADGFLGTMKRFPRLHPCEKRSTGWWDLHNKNFQLMKWSDECELIDDSNTAESGQRLILPVNVP